jgi:hypothetical protein
MLGVRRPTARRALAAGGACLLASALAGILLARVPAAQALDEAEPPRTLVDRLIPRYPQARLLSLGGPVHVNGHPRQLAYAVTDDAPSKVAERYEAIWRSQGFEVSRRTVGSEEWVHASSHSDTYLRTVAATRLNNETAIIASASDAAALPARLLPPLPPTCTPLSRTGSLDAGVASEVLQLVCRARLTELLDYYDRRLGRVAGSEMRDGAAAVVSYQRGGKEAMVAAHELSEEPPRTMLILTWQEGS